MYLKRLELLGFKSFATRTFLEFSPGITAVVGPNGSGKSNVADSMRWVLGEQSMRQLRGKKSDDIIFAGAQGKAPLGMAEVSLTLDNSTGWVPSDYSEITVTRRSYRSGENEYMINKQKVRLKDVVLLLAQARIGSDSYTVVGQGLIDAALSLRAEERRALFEDAAGIRPFQVQRTDAENRLRQTETNLERLRDIIGEIEPRLQPLSEQARRASEFNALNTELQEVLITWYSLQWRRLQSTKERADAAEREQSLKVRHQEQVLLQANEQSSGLREKRQQAQNKIVEIRKAYNEANSKVQQIERDLAVNEERVTGFERQRTLQQQEERRIREKLIGAQQQSIDLEEQYELANEAVDTASAHLAEREVEITRTQKAFEMDERRLRNTQNDLIQLQARLGASQTDLGRQQKRLGERNSALASRRETISQSQANLRTLETRLDERRAQMDELRQQEQELIRRKQGLQKEFGEAQQEQDRLKSALADAERQRRSVSDRLQMLKNWRQNLSGYGDGVRALLRAPSGKLQGLLGPVPQLGVASAGMEGALEAALGPYLQAVVVETFEHAQACLEFLHTSKAGKAMLVWLRRSNEDSAPPSDPANLLERVFATSPELRSRLSLAVQHVSCEERYQSLFVRLLRGVAVVEDLEVAQACLPPLEASPYESGRRIIERLVTRKGEVLHLDGWITGGESKDGAQQGLLVYERELHELPLQLEEHVTRIDQLNTLFSTLQRAQEARRVDLQKLERELQTLVGRINELNKTISTAQRDLERLQTELKMAASLEQQLAAEVTGLEQEIQAAQERVQAHEKAQRELAGLVETLQQAVEDQAATYRREQDELGKLRTSVAVKRQEARALHQQLLNAQAQIKDLKQQVEQQVAILKEAEQQQQALRLVIAQRRTELGEAQVQAKSLADSVSRAETQVQAVEQQISTLDQQVRQMHKQTAELEVSYRKCLLDKQKAQDALDALAGQLQEEMGISDPQELLRQAQQEDEASSSASHESVDLGFLTPDSSLSEAEEAELRKLRRRVDSLRSRLKSLGGCDPNAPQQYEEEKTRFEFLSSQVSDMDQAALQLRTIIGQLDATMAKQFEITFEAVNSRFREHFTTLFNGGSARLELLAPKETETEGEDKKGFVPGSMPSGVEVIVQPPGKKVQDLSLLSGGERALISAALLFALLEINPPPFCLLDEVDAALDESNVTRFCDILKRLAENTQFIVITHNRVTMTAAQAIYGVSMGGDSASRLLSLKLEEPVSPDRSKQPLPVSR